MTGEEIILAFVEASGMKQQRRWAAGNAAPIGGATAPVAKNLVIVSGSGPIASLPFLAREAFRFQPASDGINPALVPTRRFLRGRGKIKIPC